MIHYICYIIGFLCSSSLSSAITSTITATQFTSVISSSTNQTFPKSCVTTTVNKSSPIVTSRPSVTINPSQGEHSKVTYL